MQAGCHAHLESKDGARVRGQKGPPAFRPDLVKRDPSDDRKPRENAQVSVDSEVPPENGLVEVAEVGDLLFRRRLRIDFVTTDAAEEPRRVVALPELVGNSNGRVVDLDFELGEHDVLPVDHDDSTGVVTARLHRTERRAKNHSLLEPEVDPRVEVSGIELVETKLLFHVVDET